MLCYVFEMYVGYIGFIEKCESNFNNSFHLIEFDFYPSSIVQTDFYPDKFFKNAFFEIHDFT